MKKNIKAIVWAVCCFVLVLCVYFSSGTAAKRSREELALNEWEGRAAGPLGLTGRRVCMLYSFINYTDFKAALFYNAGLL